MTSYCFQRNHNSACCWSQRHLVASSYPSFQSLPLTLSFVFPNPMVIHADRYICKRDVSFMQTPMSSP